MGVIAQDEVCNDFCIGGFEVLLFPCFIVCFDELVSFLDL